LNSNTKMLDYPKCNRRELSKMQDTVNLQNLGDLVELWPECPE